MAPAHPRGWVAGCFFLFFFSSFLLFFFSSFLLLFFFSFLKKRSKRKSVTEQLFFSAVAVFACILHKTGGSHAGRPFFMSWAGCTGKGLASVNPLSRAVFHFFSSRKAMGASSLSFENRSKRKSVTEQLFFSAVAVFACILHKTGGSHAGRPFFMSWAGCTGKGLASVNPLSRAVFHFFSSRKENVPLP